MLNDTLTFALEGEVALSEFSSALGNFNDLLIHISNDVGGGAKVDWIIDELYVGSAVATFHGVYEDVQIIEQIVSAYEKVGESLEHGVEPPFSIEVKRSAQKLTSIVNGKITALRFETPKKDFLISGRMFAEGKFPPMKYSLGTIKGTVQTLSMRKKLSFTIWDSMFDRAVNCYLHEGAEETMRDIWGKRAIVSGKIGRQAETGRPVVIRDVRYVRKLEELTPGSYKRAKGVLPWGEGDELPESIVRRIRNEH